MIRPCTGPSRRPIGSGRQPCATQQCSAHATCPVLMSALHPLRTFEFTQAAPPRRCISTGARRSAELGCRPRLDCDINAGFEEIRDRRVEIFSFPDLARSGDQADIAFAMPMARRNCRRQAGRIEMRSGIDVEIGLVIAFIARRSANANT